MSTLPRPALLRSMTFWGGLLAVVFTLWAWKDSVRNWTGVSTGYNSVVSRNCGFGIHHSPSPKLFRLQVSRREVHIAPMDGRFAELDTLRFGRPDFGGYLELETRRELNRTAMLDGRRVDPVIWYFYAIPEPIGPGEWLMFIPYWCVLLGVVAVWLGLIYWRSRRIRRVLGGIEPSAGREGS